MRLELTAKFGKWTHTWKWGTPGAKFELLKGAVTALTAGVEFVWLAA